MLRAGWAADRLEHVNFQEHHRYSLIIGFPIEHNESQLEQAIIDLNAEM